MIDRLIIIYPGLVNVTLSSCSIFEMYKEQILVEMCQIKNVEWKCVEVCF